MVNSPKKPKKLLNKFITLLQWKEKWEENSVLILYLQWLKLQVLLMNRGLLNASSSLIETKMIIWLCKIFLIFICQIVFKEKMKLFGETWIMFAIERIWKNMTTLLKLQTKIYYSDLIYTRAKSSIISYSHYALQSTKSLDPDARGYCYDYLHFQKQLNQFIHS